MLGIFHEHLAKGVYLHQPPVLTKKIYTILKSGSRKNLSNGREQPHGYTLVLIML